MKDSFSLILIFVCFSFFRDVAFSQISFNVDSLKISNVIWICRGDMVIEDFAYGPHSHLVCSIKNNSTDTLFIHTKNVKMYLESRIKNYKHREINNIMPQSNDSMLVILPNSKQNIIGEIDLFCLYGKTTIGLNYRLVNFLPEITKMLKRACVILKVTDLHTLKAPIKNCYIENDFFIDQTFHQSIIGTD